jgi:formyl-CoA transferase
MGVSFLAQNAGKKSITLNLKHPEGKELLRRLVRTADVLVENFRPGVMERLELGYESLREEKPGLIYCAISGFGQDGPWVDRPAYDQIVQGLSGVMSITGSPETAPLRVGYPIADTVGGMTAAFAIAAALSAPRRGCFLDVSMLESMIATMGWAVSNYLIAGVEPSPNGNENVTSAPSGTFQASDGLLNIAANKDEQWVLLANHLGREDLLDDPDYATREDRKRNRQALKAELERVLMTRTAGDWTDELNDLGVPAGRVLSVPEALETKQIAKRGLLAKFKAVPGAERDIQVVRIAAKVDGEVPDVKTPPPRLGDQNAELFGELGVSAEALVILREKGVV